MLYGGLIRARFAGVSWKISCFRGTLLPPLWERREQVNLCEEALLFWRRHCVVLRCIGSGAGRKDLVKTGEKFKQESSNNIKKTPRDNEEASFPYKKIPMTVLILSCQASSRWPMFIQTAFGTTFIFSTGKKMEDPLIDLVIFLTPAEPSQWNMNGSHSTATDLEKRSKRRGRHYAPNIKESEGRGASVDSRHGQFGHSWYYSPKRPTQLHLEAKPPLNKVKEPGPQWSFGNDGTIALTHKVTLTHIHLAT